MDSQANKQRVIDAWQTFRTRDAKQIAALFTANAEWLAPADNATARALRGTHEMRGRERIAQFIAVEFGQLFVRDVQVVFKGFYADGDVVVVEEQFTATLANGHAYQNEYCFVFELEEGLIKCVREYMDTAKGARAIFGS
jgi:ketosteroid isomerase-like protein